MNLVIYYNPQSCRTRYSLISTCPLYRVGDKTSSGAIMIAFYRFSKGKFKTEEEVREDVNQWVLEQYIKKRKRKKAVKILEMIKDVL